MRWDGRPLDASPARNPFDGPDAFSEPVGGSIADFWFTEGASLLGRWTPHEAWWTSRLDQEVDPYCRASFDRLRPEAECRDRRGRLYSGVNFSSQDYLSLSTHPAIEAAAHDAIGRYGVHSAGSAALMGYTDRSLALETDLAAFLGYRDAVIFPTGWAAGFGVITTLVRPSDHVLIDVLAHNCLQVGARHATPNVQPFSHLSTESVARRLRRIRKQHPEAGILVVTETLFSMDSDTPDIAALQALCREFDATLLVDVAHDLGAMGPTGGGVLETLGLAGQVDVLIGSFSKTFGSCGGFVASSHPALKMAIRSSCSSYTFSNTLSPVQASIVAAALRIVSGDEGADRRARLSRNAERLRAGLQAAGFEVPGRVSPIVPVLLGSVPQARWMTREALRRGALVNLVEHPAVSRNTSRWRLQVMADHEDRHVDKVIEVLAGVRSDLRRACP